MTSTDSDDEAKESKSAAPSSRVAAATSNPEEEVDDDDDEEEAPLSSNLKLLAKNKKVKKKGLMVRSFDVGEGDDDDEDFGLSKKAKKKKDKKRKRVGLGFGGTSAPIASVNDDAIDVDNNGNVAAVHTSILYDKDALAKLKEEQKYKAVVAEGEETSEKDTQVQSKQQQTAMPNSENYIPLNDKIPKDTIDETMILTGDDALDFQDRTRSQNDKRRDDHFATIGQVTNVFHNEHDQLEEEESSAWEAQIAKRAGILNDNSNIVNSNGSDKPNNVYSRPMSSNESSSSSNAMSLSKLRGQIQSTISQLEMQHKDVDRACERRRVELEHTKDELKRQQHEMEESGKAVEDYQQFREELTFWTGALRDLKSKLDPIQKALVDLDADIAGTADWQTWEDDICAVLHQAGLLDRVMGRQPPDFVFEDSTTIVDEFGRDVKSQHAMGREKRIKQRLERQSKRSQTVHEDDSDAFMDEEEIDSFHERRVSLLEALEVAIGEIEDEYTHISNLAAVFQRWRSSYPEDYKQCFANLSFGDLASVLVQLWLCKACDSTPTAKGWLDGLTTIANDEPKENDAPFEWIIKLKNPASSVANTHASITPNEEETIDRIIEKCFLPLLNNVLDKSSYNLVSRKQSRSFGSLFARLKTLTPNAPHPGLDALEKRIMEYIRSKLENIAIAILNKKEVDQNNAKAEIQDAVRGATTGQLLRLSKMLANVLTFWSPYLKSNRGEDVGMQTFLLDFLSSKYLFLLSSLHGRSECTAEAFSQVWAVLQKTKLLDDPSYMLQAAPLRAAATAFRVQ